MIQGTFATLENEIKCRDRGIEITDQLQEELQARKIHGNSKIIQPRNQGGEALGEIDRQFFEDFLDQDIEQLDQKYTERDL